LFHLHKRDTEILVVVVDYESFLLNDLWCLWLITIFDMILPVNVLYCRAIQGNPWRCDCQLVPFLRFIKSRTLEMKQYVWSRDPSCQSPPNLNGTLLKAVRLQDKDCDLGKSLSNELDTSGLKNLFYKGTYISIFLRVVTGDYMVWSKHPTNII
jgi:hypothetical protein